MFDCYDTDVMYVSSDFRKSQSFYVSPVRSQQSCKNNTNRVVLCYVMTHDTRLLRQTLTTAYGIFAFALCANPLNRTHTQ